jgi:transposase
MANTLTVPTREAILNLARRGWRIRRIARELKVSRNTVRGYVRPLPEASAAALTEAIVASARPATASVQTDPLSTAGARPPSVQTDPVSAAGNAGRPSLCAAHAGIILPKVELGLTAQRIYQDLRQETAFAGSYQSVKRYVQKLRRQDPRRVQRIEVQPGEEVQVDFGRGPVLVGADGQRRKTWIFRLVLSFSRKGYSEAVLRQDTETFVRCLENAFRAFGGVTLTVNLDNLKAAVLRADWADPVFNPKLADFARHYGTTILPCLPQVPEHKGKIENGVQYVKSNGLAGRRFAAVAEVNAFLVQWERTVADVRIHGTTKRPVAERFVLEKGALLPLPASLFPCFQEGPRAVHRDGHIEVAKAFYHVPPEYLGRQVWVRFDSREVRIFSRSADGRLVQIQLHRRLEPGQFTNARGIGGGRGSLQANLDYWLQRASELGPSCAGWARGVVRHREIGGLRPLMGLVSLVERHGFAAVNRACERALAQGTWRLRDVRALIQAKEIQTQITFEEHHPLIRDLREYGIFVQTQNPR